MIYSARNADKVICVKTIADDRPMNCRAHECSAWRWAEGVNVNAGSFDGLDAGLGYCGLGGAPVNQYRLP